MVADKISGYLRLIITLFILLACVALLAGISEVTDEWTASCLSECSMTGGVRDCDACSIKFIADQYVRAVKGEPYWETAGERRFNSAAECAEFRFSQIRAICPSAAEVLRKSIR